MSIKRRLEWLEQRLTACSSLRSQRSSWIYDEIREWAQEDIEEALSDGEEPIFHIAEAKPGDVVLFRDGRPINDLRDYILALDERIAEEEE